MAGVPSLSLGGAVMGVDDTMSEYSLAFESESDAGGATSPRAHQNLINDAATTLPPIQSPVTDWPTTAEGAR